MTAVVESIAKVIGVLISPRVAATVFIVACVLLGVPLALPGWFPWIDSVVQDHKALVGFSALFSGVFCCTYVFSHVGSWVTRKRAEKKQLKDNQQKESDRLKRLHDRLGNLTVDEKHILQEYIDNDSRVAHFNATVGTAVPLCKSGVLSQIHLYGVRGAYTISDDAWAYLHEHRDLIATPDHPRPARSFFAEY
jgi:hypothetical protein